MFNVEVQGLDALLGKFDRLTKQIDDAKQEMPRQLMEWQREDMGRHYPNMQVGSLSGETIAMTSIWPRSRTYDQQHRRDRRGIKRSGPRQYTVGGRSVRSGRPILRIALYHKLVERMTELIGKAMKWP
jgi:hypothetical protein